MSPVRILVVDDHEIVRTGLRTVLEGADDLEVAGEAATADEAVVASILAGASGYLTKNAARAQLVDALRAVARGEALLEPAITGVVLDRLKELSASAAPDDPLSPREREVLALIARGLTNRQIAEALVISEHTARNHVTSILDKLGLSRRTEAAVYATRLGLISEE